jgi:hypothetical protein
MKYNFFTVLNSAYIIFGKIWLLSLLEEIPDDKIDNIIILDTGLREEEVKYLKSFNKVSILQSDLNLVDTSDALPRNSNWLQHVLRKTKFCKVALKLYNSPLIMVDSDCMFLGDVTEMIEQDKDILVCNRSYKKDDNWIASFFVVNNPAEGIKFLNSWIGRMKRLMTEQPHRGWFESHSLNLLLNEIKQGKHGEFNIGDVFTADVACEEESFFSYENTNIVHFKGTGQKTDFSGRINRFINVKHVIEKVNEYVKK